VPFFLSAPPTAMVQNAKLTQKESGVKPPHCKEVRRGPKTISAPWLPLRSLGRLGVLRGVRGPHHAGHDRGQH
jgi:hypothetical protein